MYRQILFIATLGAFFTACSGQQQSQEELETTEEQPNQEGNLGQNTTGEQNQENFSEGQEGGADDAANMVEEAPSNAVAENATLNQGGQVPTDVPAEPAPNQMVEQAPAAPAPAAAPTGEGPLPGGRVRYAKSTVNILNAPGGSPVGTLEQGDHPVTWEENGYYKMANGMYLPMDAMSDKGVPRATLPQVQP